MKLCAKLSTALAALALLIVAIVGTAQPAEAAKGGKNASCVVIQDETLTYSAGHYLAGEPLQIGYDPYGYNYQAHMFNGSYANAYLGRYGFPPYEGDDEAYLAENPDAENSWVWPYRDVQLMMKWSDIWLSNKSCDADGLLDRGGPGGTNSAAEGAWLTNHQSGTNDDGTHWTYFVKIVAVPDDAVDSDPANNSGTWYTAEGIEIGPEIWGGFAIVQQVENDPATGAHGISYKSPAGPGFGKWK